MTDYIFIIIAFFIIVIFWILLVKYILNPLFFPNYFPKQKVLEYLRFKELKFISYKKRNISITKEAVNGENLPFIYRISYFDVELINKNNQKVTLTVKQLKLNLV